jgi:excisionase family DNA binding protein
MLGLEGELLTTRTLGKLLGVDQRTAAKYLRQGLIRALRVQRQWRCRLEDYEDFVRKALRLEAATAEGETPASGGGSGR